MANFNLNKVIIGGRLTADVELKQTPTGVSVAQFSVAVNRKPRQGEAPKADFLNVIAWRQTAEFVSKYFHKGSSICIVGAIENRSWTDQQGKKHYSTDIIADEIMFVDSKGAQQEEVSTEVPEWEEVSADEDLPY